jgi:hypothetical protein
MGWVALQRKGLLRGAVAVAGSMIGATILSWLMLTLVGAIRHGMFWRAHPVWVHLAIYGATIFVAIAMLALVGGMLDRTRLRSAFWFAFLIVGGGIGLIAPGGIIFFLFPPLFVLAGMIAARWWKPAEKIGSAAAILFLYVTWGAMLGLLEELLNGGPMWIFALLGSLLLVPVLIEARPLIIGSGLRGATAISGLLALLGWAVVIAAPTYSTDRQQRFVIQHVTNFTAGKSWWSVLNDGAPLSDSFGGNWKRGKLPFSDRPRWFTSAPPDIGPKAPDIELLSQTHTGGERTLVVRLIANGNETVGIVALSDAKIRSAGVTGFVRPIDQDSGGKYFIDCSGRSCDKVTLQLTTGQLKPIEFLVLGSLAPLPRSAEPLLAARPHFARPQYNRDESITFVTRRL